MWNDLIVICYLLFVMIAPALAPSSGRADMCYDLIVICYLLFVMIAPPRTAMRALVEGENVSRRFAIPPQSRGDCTAIDPRFHINRWFRCFTLRDG
jgi:hypothetical protein